MTDNCTTSSELNRLTRYDDESIRVLFEQYYSTLVLFAKKYVLDIEVAKDVVQEVFISFVEAKETFLTIDNLKAYLYNAVRNKCLKYIRHEEVKKRYTARMQEEIEDDKTYQDRVLEEEVYARLLMEIHRLPEQQSNVYLLVPQGKNNQEIADTLGIGLETVKSHKKTGKRILFSQLKGTISINWLILFKIL